MPVDTALSLRAAAEKQFEEQHYMGFKDDIRSLDLEAMLLQESRYHSLAHARRQYLQILLSQVLGEYTSSISIARGELFHIGDLVMFADGCFSRKPFVNWYLCGTMPSRKIPAVDDRIEPVAVLIGCSDFGEQLDSYDMCLGAIGELISRHKTINFDVASLMLLLY